MCVWRGGSPSNFTTIVAMTAVDMWPFCTPFRTVAVTPGRFGSHRLRHETAIWKPLSIQCAVSRPESGHVAPEPAHAEPKKARHGRMAPYGARSVSHFWAGPVAFDAGPLKPPLRPEGADVEPKWARQIAPSRRTPRPPPTPPWIRVRIGTLDPPIQSDPCPDRNPGSEIQLRISFRSGTLDPRSNSGSWSGSEPRIRDPFGSGFWNGIPDRGDPPDPDLDLPGSTRSRSRSKPDRHDPAH